MKRSKGGPSSKRDKGTSGISRRDALRNIGVAGLVAGGVMGTKRSALAQPAAGKRTIIKYWGFADNPVHQKMSVDCVEMFNKAQDKITVELDATSLIQELRTKVVTAFAAGSAPDLAGTVITHVQDYYENGIIEPLEPFINKWDAKSDLVPSTFDYMRVKPNQPLLWMPTTLLPYVLYYRADWFQEANLKPPVTYDEFIAAAKALTRPDRYGYALRGLDYYAVQPLEPIWSSAGVKFVDEKGNVDYASPAAIDVTEKWVGMYTKDKSCQPTAVNDRYSQLFAVMEQGKCGMWLYGTHAHPQLDKALGDRIQCVTTPNVGSRKVMLANPEGLYMLSTCKEKEAAFEFLKFMASGEPVRIFTQKRGQLPFRKSIAAEPYYQNNRFFKVALDNSEHWWMPPCSDKNWANYQDKLAPYWQQALRQEITVKQFQETGAKLLRGEA
jgi:multiple sugar transport system substrate-binding protein